MRTETIYVEKISHGGIGIGRLNSGQVVFIQGALPGEYLIVTIRQQKKNYLFADVSQILIPHPGRIVPPCPYHKCGGCNLHHGTYQVQLALKEAVLTELLNRQDSELAAEAAACRRAILPSKRQFGYRQRIRLLVQEGRMGYRAHASHEFVATGKCLLAEAPLNRVLYRLQEAKGSAELLALCDEMELLLNPVTEGVVVLLHFLRPPRPGARKMAERVVAEIDELERLFFTGKDFALEGPYPESTAGRRLQYPCQVAGQAFFLSFEAGGFCQVNLLQNEKLVETVLALADVKKGERILDLYCGMGNLSLPLAMKGADVVGVESQGSAIRSARYNARQTNLSVQFIKAAVESACNDLVAENQIFDTVVIDPPRGGVPGMAPLFSRLAKKKLLYISCDPATLVRDLFSLRQEGFQITAFQPVDMFPQTHHIECIVFLKKME